ncbi:MAG: flagellar filament capping protein FliD [Candidatus Cloacimonetes bacterium]|nr:flagellar filament capping protein FliD [Candidatus Cloacimonadota bacterium]
MSKEDIEKLDEDLRNQALAGDPLLQRAYNLLRSFSYNRVQGLTGINSLSALGISTGSFGSTPEQTRIGKLQIVDQEKFDTALNDKLSEVRDFFTRKDEGLTNSQLGIGERLKLELRKFTGFDGLLTRKAGRPGQTVSSSLIDRQIASLSLEILNKNRSLLKYQESLLLTFQNMESALSQLQGQSNALSQSSGGL